MATVPKDCSNATRWIWRLIRPRPISSEMGLFPFVREIVALIWRICGYFNCLLCFRMECGNCL